MKKRLADLSELVFQQVDNLGYQLDAIGVENQITRHRLIAALFAGQKRFEGEVDSIKARTESTKANVEAALDAAENLAKSGLSLITFPATYTYSRIKQLA